MIVIMMITVIINVFADASIKNFTRQEFDHMTISRLTLQLNLISLLRYESTLRKALTGKMPA
jgi:hypothetical protein